MSSQFGFLIPSKKFSTEQAPQKPDYSFHNNWASLPLSNDESNVSPPQLKNKNTAKKADCFFVHPTGFFLDEWNCDISYKSSASDRVKLTLATQASAFNEQCDIYAPQYRQATYSAIATNQGKNSSQALNLAYEDIKNSFKFYMNNFKGDNPLILSAHSQGALHCQRLLSEPSLQGFFKENLVAAYLIGYPLDELSMKNIDFKVSKSPDDTSCIIQFGSVGVGAKSLSLGGVRDRIKFWMIDGDDYSLREIKKLSSTNPALWFDKNEWQNVPKNSFIMPKINGKNIFFNITARESSGTIIKEINYAEAQDIKARIRQDGLLETKGLTIERILKKNLDGSLDLHIWDYQLFWGSIRSNAALRINTFLKNKDESK